MMALETLIVVLFTVHIGCVGVATFAPFHSLTCELIAFGRPRKTGPSTSNRYETLIASVGIWSLILGAIVGFAYGVCLIDDQFTHALARLKSRIGFGIIEWVFSLIILIMHRWWWGRRPHCGKPERAARCFVLFAAASNLLYHFPVLFEVLNQIKRDVGDHQAMMSSAEFRQWIIDARVLSQVFHFFAASLLFGCAAGLIAINRWPRELAANQIKVRRRVYLHLIWACTSLQFAIGCWVVVNLRPMEQNRLTSLNNVGGWLFGVAVLASIALIPHAVFAAFGDDSQRKSDRIAIHVGIILILMCVLSRVLTQV